MDLDDLVVMYAQQLRDAPSAMAYLRNRGLSEATIARYKLGFVAQPLHAAHQRFGGAITIPYLNPDGTARTVRFRHLRPGSKRKYDNLKGERLHLYNVAHTAQHRVWLCEGEFDSLILTQMGHPAVGVPGSNGFNTDWKYLFVNCDQVSLVFDSDEAGERAMLRLASVLGDSVDDLRVLRLPKGMDVNDLYLEDAQALEELVS